MLVVDPDVMNSADNNLAANWTFSTITYDFAGNQVGTRGLQNDAIINSTENILLAEEISISPNPANTVMNIVTEIEGDLTIELYDMVGKKLRQAQLNQQSIDVSQLPVGIYMVRIGFAGGSVTKRVAIQR